jgi:hypothetical protein
MRIVNQRVPKPSKLEKNKGSSSHLEAIMDAKWNDIIDRFSTRLLLLAVGFGVWLAISYGVLAA